MSWHPSVSLPGSRVAPGCALRYSRAVWSAQGCCRGVSVGEGVLDRREKLRDCVLTAGLQEPNSFWHMGICSCRGRFAALPRGAWSGLAGASLSAHGPTTELQGFALQPPRLAPFPPGPALSKAFGVMETGEELFQLTAGIGGFSIWADSRGALCLAILGTMLLPSWAPCSCHPGHHALAICLWHAGSCWSGAVSMPGRRLQAGDACP